MRRCYRCRKQKPEAEFNWRNVAKRIRNTDCCVCQRERNNIRTRALRLKVLAHYGGAPPRCACCGEQHPEFLALDHVNGGGRKHRQTIKIRWWEWLRNNGFPPGFRVLCHNCNQAIGVYGFCPHKKSTPLTSAEVAAYDENAPNRSYKLTREIVEEIRCEIERGTSQVELARRYKVSRATICMIGKRKRWAD